MFIAAPLLVVGQSLRFWAAGVIPKYRALSLDAPRLVVWGPYALVRNPLYAGNALLGYGWALMAGWMWALAFAAAYLVVYQLVIIPYEESFLMEKFRDDYLAYKTATPSLIPRLSGLVGLFGGAEKNEPPFDREKSWFMERHSLFMNAIVTALVMLRLFVLD
jgi:protein-S-isoprenylcysteine O-methyltransferase Ste14